MRGAGTYGEQQAQMAEGDPPAFEIYRARASAAHEWFWFPELTREETVAFVTYDSHPEARRVTAGGGAGAGGGGQAVPFIPTMHTAVELPGTEGAKVRESVEARVCVLLPLPPGEAEAPSARL